MILEYWYLHILIPGTVVGMRQQIKFVCNVLIIIALDRAFQMEQNDTNISYGIN